MSTSRFTRRSALLLGAAFTTVLAGCAVGVWKTEYQPIPQLAANWRLAGVSVNVPKSLIVSENNSVYVPAADIVWQEEDLGDRRAQVKSIISEGIRSGARGLKGSTPVRIEATLVKFHALNRKSLYSAPEGTGVENIVYNIRVVNANSGAELLPATRIRAELPGLTGNAYQNARARGQSQRDRIVAHVSRTTAGWLGLGPDNRGSFNRQGG